jgi:hypothetical protein
VDGPKSYKEDVLCEDYPRHLKLHVVTKYFSNLSHYFPYFSENYIFLSPCHNRSSGQTQILSNGCIVLRLSESYNCYMWLRRTISSCLLATVEVVDKPKSYKVDVLCVHYSSHQKVICGYEVVFSLIPLLSLLLRELYLLVSLPQ